MKFLENSEGTSYRVLNGILRELRMEFLKNSMRSYWRIPKEIFEKFEEIFWRSQKEILEAFRESSLRVHQNNHEAFLRHSIELEIFEVFRYFFCRILQTLHTLHNNTNFQIILNKIHAEFRRNTFVTSKNMVLKFQRDFV